MCSTDKDPCEMPEKFLKGKPCVWHKAEHNQRPGSLKSVSMKKEDITHSGRKTKQ